MASKRDCYEVLGVARDADEATLALGSRLENRALAVRA